MRYSQRLTYGCVNNHNPFYISQFVKPSKETKKMTKETKQVKSVKTCKPVAQKPAVAKATNTKPVADKQPKAKNTIKGVYINLSAADTKALKTQKGSMNLNGKKVQGTFTQLHFVKSKIEVFVFKTNNQTIAYFDKTHSVLPVLGCKATKKDNSTFKYAR